MLIPFLSKSGFYSNRISIDKSSIIGHKAGFECLEERVLLSRMSLNQDSSLLANYSSSAIEDVEVVSISPLLNNTVVDVSSIHSGPQHLSDVYDIEYELLESGNVRVLGQTGVQKVSTMDYCSITDPKYIILWEKAISRWEDVIAEGVDDVVYPYAVDGYQELVIDDLFLYLGFSDSFSSNSSLGSALNAGFYRNGGSGTAATGSLVFNANYFVSNPSESVQTVFYNTALHEIGHALGYNVTHFKKLNLLESSLDIPYALDEVFTSNSTYWYYVGEKGVEQYRQTFPDYFLTESSYSNGFLMETYTASGSYAAHISSILGTYYQYLNQRDGMTYSISPNFEATITNTTLGILEDLGYRVNYHYCDLIGSPSPESLTTEAIGKTVILNWEPSVGDLSNGNSGSARYQIERLDVRSELNAEESWRIIATDIEGTEWIDTTVESGHEYSYRVRACHIRSNQEIGVFRAQAGDEITWDSDASKFTIYALVNNGSDMVGWTRVVSSTTSKKWTVTSLPKTPENGTSLFRVVAVGTILSETHSSKISNVAISTRADNYIPEGYSATDWRALKIFLETKDDRGIKNGYKIDGKTYSPDFLQNVSGLSWKKINGIFHLVSINWEGYDLVGNFNLLGCSEITKVNIKHNSINNIYLDSFKLSILNVSSNHLTKLDISELIELESLVCSNNKLESLDVSNNLNLIFLDCSDNKIKSLNLEENWKLTKLDCHKTLLEELSLTYNTEIKTLSPWSEALKTVYLPSCFASVVNLSDSDAISYEWILQDEVTSREASFGFDGSNRTVDVNLSFKTHSQDLVFYVGNSNDTLATPSNLTFGALNDGLLPIYWIDNATGEIGYKVYCRVNDGDWTLVESIVSSKEISTTKGSKVTRTATGINVSNIYSFRICAYSVNRNGAEIESDLLYGTYVAISTIDRPLNFIAKEYNPQTETLKLSWNPVETARYYEVQYRRSDNNGESWLNSWTHAETIAATSRTAVCVHENSYYGFRVRAITSSGDVSDWSELTFSYLPDLSPPAKFVVSKYNPSAQTLELSWSPVEFATHYEVQYRIATGADTNWGVWTHAEITNSTSRIANKVYAPYSYEFRVRAHSNSGERSGWTNVTFASTSFLSVGLLDAVFSQGLFLEDISPDEMGLVNN